MQRNLATSFDKKSYNHAIIMVTSFLNNYFEEQTLNLFCFVTEDLLSKQQDFIEKVGSPNFLNIRFIISDRWLKESKSSKILSSPCWHKIFMASELNEIDNILYIGSNTMFQRNVNSFINYNYFGTISGVIDNYGMSQVIFNDKDSLYYWHDVMYADLKAWRELNFEDWAVDYANKLLMNTINKENDALNIFFKKYERPMPYYFGYPVRMQTDWYFNWVYTNPLNVVFSGEYKPWTFHGFHPYEIVWRNEYERLFNEPAPQEKTLKNGIFLND